MFTAREQILIMNNKDIIQPALKQLQVNTGFTATYHHGNNPNMDGWIDLHLAEGNIRFFACIKNEIKAYQLAEIALQAQQNIPYIVVANKIYPAIKEHLKQKRIAYLDTAGNAFLHYQNVLIYIHGNKQITQQKQDTNRAFTKTGLKAVFYFLLNPTALELPYRTLAKKTGVALGNIKNIMDGLKETGYLIQIEEKKFKLQNKKALLERWIDGYKETLKPAMHIGDFALNNIIQNKLLQKQLNIGEVLLGGEPAAEMMTEYLHPEKFTVYTTLAKLDLMRKFRILPEENGNLKLYKKFWNENIESQPFQNLAPTILVYADLIITDDPRCIETAHLIYEKYLKHEFQ